jgi:hypothetical protein
VIDLVRAGALEVPDPRRQLDRRRQADGQMHVVLDAADGVHQGARGLERPMDQVFVRQWLDALGEQGMLSLVRHTK